MTRRITGWVLATLLGSAPSYAFARTTVGSPAQIVPADRIASLAQHVAQSLVNDPDRALVPAFAVADVSVPAGVLSIVAGSAQLNSTYLSVPIAINVDGHPARTVFAGFRITTFVQMPVAMHDLAPGSVIGVDDLGYARVPLNGRPGLEMATFIGRKVRTVIARGAVLYPELTSVNEIVRAGMPALLIVCDGRVRLAADVIARSSGGLGDYVTIYNPQTQRALSGIVTGPNTVELTLPGEN